MSLLALKRRLVGTPIGSLLQSRRAASRVRSALRGNPEQGGMIAQAACAEMLLPGICDPNETFLDIGAHIGSVIGSVLGRHPDVDVVAIEADPEKARALASRFPHATVHACAVGNEPGEVSFFVNTDKPGYSSLDPREADHQSTREIVVPMKTLDQLLPDGKRVGTIKIDVEGAELAALQGGEALVSRCRPTILFESGPPRPADDTTPLTALFDWFAERDYEVCVPNRVAHNGPGLGREGFVEGHYYPFRTLDYFAIPRERRIVVRDGARLALGVGA